MQRKQRTIKLWKDNRLDQEYSLTDNEIWERFKVSQQLTAWKNLEYSALWPMPFRFFLAEKDGLSSVMEDKDLVYMDKFLWSLVQSIPWKKESE